MENARAAQRLVNAYHRLFGCRDGKLVLADIRKSFGAHLPAFIPLERGRGLEYDPLHAAIRDGQRQVILHIEHKLNLSAKGDSDVEKPATETIKQ